VGTSHRQAAVHAAWLSEQRALRLCLHHGAVAATSRRCHLLLHLVCAAAATSPGYRVSPVYEAPRHQSRHAQAAQPTQSRRLAVQPFACRLQLAPPRSQPLARTHPRPHHHPGACWDDSTTGRRAACSASRPHHRQQRAHPQLQAQPPPCAASSCALELCLRSGQCRPSSASSTPL
jgi:hypothetical protein